MLMGQLRRKDLQIFGIIVDYYLSTPQPSQELCTALAPPSHPRVISIPRNPFVSSSHPTQGKEKARGMNSNSFANMN
ncbi:hypothetical protein RJT34_08696 [Clitoria ternatea]|uniref:Uncharacterized protein n=1 Tax=Clitoria ternatea TaxID=43366 RepID=A0AAN9PUS3_CLITE